MAAILQWFLAMVAAASCRVVCVTTTIPIVAVSAPGQFYSMVLSFGLGSFAWHYFPHLPSIPCRVTPLLCSQSELASSRFLGFKRFSGLPYIPACVQIAQLKVLHFLGCPYSVLHCDHCHPGPNTLPQSYTACYYKVYWATLLHLYLSLLNKSHFFFTLLHKLIH